MINLSKFLPFFIPNVFRACSFFTNLDLFCIDNARVIYGKIRYLLSQRHSLRLGQGCLSRYNYSLPDGPSADRILVGGEIFRTRPDRPWGPPSLLYNRSFPGVKRPRRGVGHPTPSSAEVKERVELFLYSPSGPSWSVLGWTLPLLFNIPQHRCQDIKRREPMGVLRAMRHAGHLCTHTWWSVRDKPIAVKWYNKIIYVLSLTQQYIRYINGY